MLRSRALIATIAKYLAIFRSVSTQKEQFRRFFPDRQRLYFFRGAIYLNISFLRVEVDVKLARKMSITQMKCIQTLVY